MIKNLKYIGYQFYSKLLSTKCTTLLVISDHNWYFYSHKHERIIKAGTPFSYFLNNKGEI